MSSFTSRRGAARGRDTTYVTRQDRGRAHQLLGKGVIANATRWLVEHALQPFSRRSEARRDNEHIASKVPAERVLLTAFCRCSARERIRTWRKIQGVRTNQLVGYGLVVGLDGTGDQTSQAPFTISRSQYARAN